MIINYDFELNHHTKIIFGAGKVAATGETTKNYGTKALVVSDSGIRKAGIVDKVKASLDAAGVTHIVYDNVMTNPRDMHCVEAKASRRYTMREQRLKPRDFIFYCFAI